MAISFVNGFLCTSSCDVAKARKGEDPHPSVHGTPDDLQKPDGRSRADQPAVLFGGALAEIARSQPTDLPADELQGRFVDRLA